MFLLAAACEEGQPTEAAFQDGDTVTEVPAGATAVTYGEIQEATTQVSSIQERERGIISTQVEWEAYWVRFAGSVQPMPPAPTVDFNAERVVTAAMGGRPTGGYGISVPEVRGDPDAIYVVIMETSPGPSCIVTQATTAPALAVRVPADNRPVVFVEETQVLDC
ncbi:MAG: protease complex subunit PrcB family protein [Gemmatimonadetes bacterium]|nr:protease complex subunit PrcB family protein [Gemmatimonadota bacterium]